jgi:transcriptional regulator with XRE-family HTH domain
MPISADQCRAARALLEISQEELGERSGVSKRSIAEFERGEAVPYGRTLAHLRDALEAAGIDFIAENGGGSGVRRKAAVPRLARKRISGCNGIATLAVNFRGQDYKVEMSTEILDDLDHSPRRTDDKLSAAVDLHINKILLAAARAIDAGRAGDALHVILVAEDFNL